MPWNLLEKFTRIKTFVFDVDGVLTNGKLLLMPEGHFVRDMNIKDGYAIQYAIKLGYSISIISGGNSEEIVKRLEYLGINDVFIRVQDKKKKLLEYLNTNNLELDEVLYVGDDVPDLEVMQMVGLACCPCDAVVDILGIAHYVSRYSAGNGCCRDVIEKVLKLNNHWIEDNSIISK